MENKLFEWVRQWRESRDAAKKFNRQFVITEQRDGFWVIAVFDENKRKTSETIVSPGVEAWRVLFVLTGHNVDEDTQIIKERSEAA